MSDDTDDIEFKYTERADGIPDEWYDMIEAKINEEVLPVVLDELEDEE